MRLTEKHRSWGFGLCYLYLRNVKCFVWNHLYVFVHVSFILLRRLLKCINTSLIAKRMLLCYLNCMSKSSSSRDILPYEVKALLSGAGEAMRRARLARNEGIKTVAERLGVHAQTISRLEKGDPGVSSGVFLAAMAQYGKLAELFTMAEDSAETEILLRKGLPQRGRS
jgi:DNA-binding XRE family transcriptional regulator